MITTPPYYGIVVLALLGVGWWVLRSLPVPESEFHEASLAGEVSEPLVTTGSGESIAKPTPISPCVVMKPRPRRHLRSPIGHSMPIPSTSSSNCRRPAATHPTGRDVPNKIGSPTRPLRERCTRSAHDRRDLHSECSILSTSW